MTTPPIFFSDYFGVNRAHVDSYGAFDLNLLADVPLFVDPFLLFNSPKPEYQELHEEILRYLRFLKSIALDDLDDDTVRDLFRFQEVSQNWFGYCEFGNKGHGLGEDFARALRQALGRILNNFGEEGTTRSSHLEKVSLIRPKVGLDNISDFTTNLIKRYLVDYTEEFARLHIDPARRVDIAVPRIGFNYDTETWVSETRNLPVYDGDYVLLTPTDMLVRDATWINYGDMIQRYPEIADSVEDGVQRSRINRYFERRLSELSGRDKEKHARQDTISRFPELLDVYIALREAAGDQAVAVSREELDYLRKVFVDFLSDFVRDFWQQPEMADRPPATSLEEALYRVGVFKKWVEDKDGWRSLNDARGRAKEADVQRLLFLTLQVSKFDVNREVNNGRGPVDIKVSIGSKDSSLIEVKLASNTGLKRNLERQVEIYQRANETPNAVKVIVYYSEEELRRVEKILRSLGLDDNPNVILVNARSDDKPSGSLA
ncbi:hypothetical protein [Pseudolysinimonas sp.]